MPTVAEHRGDPLKDYGWILLVAVLFVGGWLSLSSPSSTGGDSVQVAVRDEVAEEQSLRSLDNPENPSGAPGGAMEMPGGRSSASGAGGKADEAGSSSSLYQAPGGAAGSPIPEGAAAAIEAAAKGQTSGGTSLAEALKGVADSPSKAPDNGWGGATPQTGFSKPKAAFGQIGASRSGGGGSTSASLVTVDKAFGTGGNVGLNLGPGLDASGQAGKLAAAAKGANLEGLKAARKAGLDALRQGDEMAVSKGRQSFDGGAAGKGALNQLQSAGAASGAGMGDDGGVPMNLKANDPNKLDQKKIEPPEIGEGKEVQDSSNKQFMQQQMMMMMMGMMMMGVMGPAGGQMMSMMMPMMQMGMQMQQAEQQLKKDNVKSRS